jgi:hypothetical protein
VNDDLEEQRRSRSQPGTDRCGQPAARAVLHDFGFGGRGGLGGTASRSLGRVAASPPSCPTQTSVPEAPTIRPGHERTPRCLYVVTVLDWSGWLRPGCARRSFRVASTAIPVSILTSRQCHTDRTYVSLSAVCWFWAGRRTARKGWDRAVLGRMRPVRGCAWLPILRIAFHTVRLLPGWSNSTREGRHRCMAPVGIIPRDAACEQEAS